MGNSIFKNKYRIVKGPFPHRYLSRNEFPNRFFVVQTKKWWFPFFWFACDMLNLFYKIEDAEDYIVEHKEKIKFKNKIKSFISAWKRWKKYKKTRVIKYVK